MSGERRSRAKPSRIIAFVLFAVVAVPATSAAQKEQFFDSLLPFYRALAGVTGDEGPQLKASVDSFSAALAAWDDSIRTREAALRARLAGADPQTAMQVHTLLASMYSERGRWTDALREFDEDIRLDPRRAAFHRLKALVLLELNRRADATAAFRAAWLADPSDPQNAYALIVNKPAGTTAAEKNRAQATLSALEGALIRGERQKAGSPFLSLRPIDDDTGGAMAFAPAAYARAFSLLLTGRLDTGLPALRDAVAADPLLTDRAPGSSESRRIRAAAAFVDGDVAAALQDLRDAVRLNPKNERAWLALAGALEETGEAAEAADLLHKAIAELPDAGALRWQLTELSAKRQRTDAADLELMATAERLTLLAGNAELYVRIAKVAQAHLDYARAIALLERAVRLTPNKAGVHSALGRAYVDQGRDEEGYAELVVALWLDPADAATLTALGQMHLAAGRIEPAVDALRRAVDQDPGDAAAVHALGEALVRAGRTADAGPIRDEAERLQARSVDTQRRLRTLGMLTVQAELLMAERNYARAVEVWREAASVERRSASVHERLAEALRAAGQLDQAVVELQAAIALNGGIDLHRRLAGIYTALGRSDDSARERGLYRELRLQELRQK